MDGQSVGEHKLGEVVVRQGVELRIVEIGGWGVCGIVRHNTVGETQEVKRCGERPCWIRNGDPTLGKVGLTDNAWSGKETFWGSGMEQSGDAGCIKRSRGMPLVPHLQETT